MKSLSLFVLVFFTSFVVAQEAQPSPAGAGKQEEQPKVEATPSLLQLATQTRDQKAQVTSDVPVLRNEDLDSLKRARVVTSQAGRAGTASVAGMETESPVVDGPGEDSETPGTEEIDLESWRNAFSEAKLALENAVNRLMVLELRMNNLRNAYLQTQDGTTRERIEAELNQSYLDVEQAREDEKAARQALSDLERQAAKAGVAPGQVREMIGELPQSKSIFDAVPQSQDGLP